jgi:type II secretory pathway component GspD/PulD (secretin)
MIIACHSTMTKRTISVFLILIVSSLIAPAGAVTIYSTTGEADDAPPPQREIVGTYENIQGRAKTPEMRSKVVRIKYASIDKAVETVSRVIPNLIAVKNDDSNSIILRGEAPDVNDAARLIDSLDKKAPQILIEGKVVEVSQSGLSDIGIVWGEQQGIFKFSVDRSTGGISQADDVAGALDALIASGKARLIANPKITALDRKEAEINIGSRIPYAVPAGYSSTYAQWTVQYIDAGVNLKILPSVAGDGTIVATIRPEVSNISEWSATSAGEFPVISTRNASVTVRLKDGETLVIGGLINESDRENVSGIPFLSDIPLIGWFFQRKVNERTKTDVVFLITPHIMR